MRLEHSRYFHSPTLTEYGLTYETINHTERRTASSSLAAEREQQLKLYCHRVQNLQIDLRSAICDLRSSQSSQSVVQSRVTSLREQSQHATTTNDFSLDFSALVSLLVTYWKPHLLADPTNHY